MFLKHNQFSIALFLIIFMLCLLPGSEVPKSGLQSLDKVVHVVLFCLFTFCAMIGFTKQHQFPVLSEHVVPIVVTLSVLYGVSIEVFQGRFLTDRAFEWYDIFADSFGVFIGFLAYKFVMGGFMKGDFRKV